MVLSYALLCLAILLGAFLLSTAYVSVFYHRGLAHGALSIPPRARRFIAITGCWVTGIDPKAWVCMHRLHHRYADEEGDPHSPVNVGIPGVLLAQLRFYEKALAALTLGKKSYSRVVEDLDFPISWPNRKQLWYLPHMAQIGAAVLIALIFDAWIFAACLYAGLMSHPVQGWLVNSFGHAVGYRNFRTPDNSRNNLAVAWLAHGEGLQNNHHHDPDSARFSYHWWEPDSGYALCRLFQWLGWVSINKDRVELAPNPVTKAPDATSSWA
jgi:stearoyl-CoA desaturase (delta-9 desaturase)